MWNVLKSSVEELLRHHGDAAEQLYIPGLELREKLWAKDMNSEVKHI